jgi:hypothetical protein
MIDLKTAVALEQQSEDLLIRAIEEIVFIAVRYPAFIWLLLDAKEKQTQGKEWNLTPELVPVFDEWKLIITGRETGKEICLLTPDTIKALDLLFDPVPNIGVRITLPPQGTAFSKKVRSAFERAFTKAGVVYAEPRFRLGRPHQIIFPWEND